MAITETTHTQIKRVQDDWLCDTAGDASTATTGLYTGQVLAAVFEPDAGGTQPTNLYDVVVNDADGYDVLQGNGANLSNAANVYKELVADGLGAFVNSALTVVVSNAGDSKGGKVTLFIR